MRRATYILPVIVILIVALMASIFIVDERKKALVLQFGQIRQVYEEPGLYFKVPFIQEVVTYDDRILSLDTPEIEVTPSDDRRLLVDAFARYRIDDVVRFRQAVGVSGIAQAEANLTDILIDNIRAVLGSDGVESNTILSAERADLMNRIRDRADARAEAIGISVVDVRLKQTNLPEQNLEETFARMRSEREREATDERARGAEAAQRVRAQADRTVIELTSDATREAEIIRGEADAQRNSIYADAYSEDQDFFRFYRSLAAYTRALQGQNSTMIITPDSEFFEFLDGSAGITFPVRPAEGGADAGAEQGTESGAGGSGTDGTGTGTAPDTQATTDEQASTGGESGTAAPAQTGTSADTAAGDAGSAGTASGDAGTATTGTGTGSAASGDTSSGDAAPVATVSGDTATGGAADATSESDAPVAETAEN